MRHVFVLKPAQIEAVELERQPLWNNKRDEHGPFDIIGDVHGCFDELETLIKQLGYDLTRDADRFVIAHPQQRKLVFIRYLVDRGLKIAEVLRLVIFNAGLRLFNFLVADGLVAHLFLEWGLLRLPVSAPLLV